MTNRPQIQKQNNGKHKFTFSVRARFLSLFFPQRGHSSYPHSTHSDSGTGGMAQNGDICLCSFRAEHIQRSGMGIGKHTCINFQSSRSGLQPMGTYQQSNRKFRTSKVNDGNWDTYWATDGPVAKEINFHLRSERQARIGSPSG